MYVSYNMIDRVHRSLAAKGHTAEQVTAASAGVDHTEIDTLIKAIVEDRELDKVDALNYELGRYEKTLQDKLGPTPVSVEPAQE